MPIIFVASIIISVTIAICLILVLMRNMDRRRTTSEFLDRFRKLAIKNDHSISNQEILAGTVLGLDELQKKLFILTKRETSKYDSIIIDLSEVKGCFKRKTYRYLNTGSKKTMYEKYIDKIVLEFEFLDERHPVQITFFDSFKDSFLTKSELDQKSTKWEGILSTLVEIDLKKIV